MISVAMCTYNGEKYIKEQLESIINQSVPPDEIVICDDCSKDNTISIIKRTLTNYTGKIQLVINEHNIGYKKNFEKAISLCTGDIIFLSDQDDVWLKNKIEVMRDAINTDISILLAFHDVEIVDEDLKLIKVSFWNILNFDYKKFQKNDYRKIFEHNVVQGSASVLKKELFYYARPFPEVAIHDEWLGLTAIAKGKILPVNIKLAKYRQSSSNAIGAETKVFLKKLKILVTKLQKQNSMMLTSLKRRQLVLEYFYKCYAEEALVKSMDLKKFIDFYAKRLESLENKKLVELIKLNYWEIFITKRWACRKMIRDIIACIF